MALARIAIFSGLSPRQRTVRKKFTECTRTCRKGSPGKDYGPCLRSCLKPKKKKSGSRSRRKKK